MGAGVCAFTTIIVVEQRTTASTTVAPLCHNIPVLSKAIKKIEGATDKICILRRLCLSFHLPGNGCLWIVSLLEQSFRVRQPTRIKSATFEKSSGALSIPNTTEKKSHLLCRVSHRYSTHNLTRTTNRICIFPLEKRTNRAVYSIYTAQTHTLTICHARKERVARASHRGTIKRRVWVGP
jgi:hypothetical protein